MERALGIDLGTTNSCVAIIEEGGPKVIHTREGGRTLPSIVAWSEKGTLVGEPAKRQAITNPTRTVHGAKRLMGQKFAVEGVQEWAGRTPYRIVEAENGDAWVQVEEARHSPQEVSAIILKEVKAIAEGYLGESVSDAVITVPAYFNEVQREATKDAAAIAGLNVKKIINEPTAAALGYGVHKEKDQTLAVFDLGGGTFDITIMRIEDGVFEVLSTNGDTSLGGEDFDRCLMDSLIGDFHKTHGIDLSTDPVALQRLRSVAETAKRELSSTLSTSIELPFICQDPDGQPLHLQAPEISRTLFEKLTMKLLDRLEPPCVQALKDADLSAADLDRVLLVGGMTRSPIVEERVEKIFNLKPSKGTNPDEIVAIGAATQTAIMAGVLEDVILLDVTPHSLGIRVKDGGLSVLIPRNTTIPTSASKVFATTQDNQAHVDIEIYQGETGVVRDAIHLGRFQLGDLPQGSAGSVHVDVNFLIDADGMVQVTAKEMEKGKEASVTISATSGLSKDEIQQLTKTHSSSPGR